MSAGVLSPIDIQNACRSEEGVQSIGVMLASSVSPEANPTGEHCNYVVDILRKIILSNSPTHRYYALMILNLCIDRGDTIFLKKVSERLLKDLVSMALAKGKKVGAALPNYISQSEAYFYINLIKFIKTWGEVHTFIEGAMSDFYKAFEQLAGAGVDFAAELPAPRAEQAKKQARAPKPEKKPSPERIEAQAQEIIGFATQLDVDMWTADKEMANQVYSQIKALRTAVTNAIAESEQHPEMDLTSLLNLNTKLSDLHDLIIKAAKGNRAAAIKISKLNDPSAVADQPVEEHNKRPMENANMKEDKKGEDDGGPTEVLQYMQNEIDNLLRKNEELSKQNSDLLRKIATLESSLHNKGISVPKQSTFAFQVISLNLPSRPFHIPKSPIEESKVAPIPSGFSQTPTVKKEIIKLQESLKPENLELYKECILSSNGKLYENSDLIIAIVRNIDTPNKEATLKVNFFNKTNDKHLFIHKFYPLYYDKTGTFYAADFLIALTVAPVKVFPLKVPPGEQIGMDLKITLRKYLTETTLAQLEYEFAL